MATEYKDVIRVVDTEANLLSNLKNGMMGFASDTFSICFKSGGTLYKIKSTNSLTDTYIPYSNSGVLDDSIISMSGTGIVVDGSCKINLIPSVVGAATRFLVEGPTGTIAYRTAAEILSDLSGSAGDAFDWNYQNITNVNDLAADGTITCLSLDITSISDYNVPYNFINALSDSPIWVDDGKIGIGTGSADGKLHVLTGSAGTVTGNALSRDLTVESNTNGGISILTPDANDSRIIFGTPTDASGAEIHWDYTDSEFSIGASSTGADTILTYGGGSEGMRLLSDGGIMLNSNVKSGATQVAAGAAANELWKTSGHATLPDNVLMIGA